jgi:small subunit ribosomal protein S2
MPDEVEKPQEEIVMDDATKEMADAGVFYGRTKAKTNPQMKPFILANRNGVEIIDVDKTKEILGEALAFLTKRVSEGARVLLLATQPAAHPAVKDIAAEFGMPIVTRRWLGGTLTNFKVIARRVEYWKKLKSDLVEGKLKNYTKKEQLEFQKEADRLDETLLGLENLTARPELLIVLDPMMHKTAVLEAKRLGIPVISYVNTDADPALVTFAIPGNTKARTSIEWFLAKVKEAVSEGKKQAPVTSEQNKATISTTNERS